jgi:hypothetical protein
MEAFEKAADFGIAPLLEMAPDFVSMVVFGFGAHAIGSLRTDYGPEPGIPSGKIRQQVGGLLRKKYILEKLAPVQI